MAIRVSIEVDERQLRKLVFDYIRDQLGNINLEESDIHIQVKSKQNYKSEWEEAAFKAVVEKQT